MVTCFLASDVINLKIRSKWSEVLKTILQISNTKCFVPIWIYRPNRKTVTILMILDGINLKVDND